MFWLDTAILAVLSVAAIFGARSGLVWQLARVLGLAASLYAAIAVNGPASALMQDVFLYGADPRLASLLAYVVVFLSVYLVICFVSCLIREGIQATPLEPLDRALGAGLGVVKAAGVLAVVCWAAASLPHPKTHEIMEKSTLAPMLADGMEAVLLIIPSELKQDLWDGVHNLKALARPKS